MVRRQRKSQKLHAASLLKVKKEEEDEESKPPGVSGLRHAVSDVKVKLEIGDDHSKPNNLDVRRALSDVKVKLEIDDDHSKPNNLDGCKMAHAQRKTVRRGRRVKYGKGSRHAYIMSIAHRMKSSPNRLVPAVEGRLLHNVLNHLIDAIVSSQTAGSGEKAIEVDIGSDGCDSPVTLVNREFILKKILTLLLCMARRRHYNPPSDSEIVYYRELKRHIRCVIAYHEAKGRSGDVQWEYSKDPAGYHSLSCSQTVSAVEELIELTGSLRNATSQFKEFSQNNVAVLAPSIALHVRMDFKSLPEPDWSVEKTNAFYYSKLILVLHDLKCSGLVGLPPESNEKKSINTLLDYITSSHLRVKKEYEVCDSVCKPVGATTTTRKRGIDVLMDDGDDDVLMDDGDDDDIYPLGALMFTVGFFDGRLIEYMKQLRRSCLTLMLFIMGKLEPDCHPVTLFPVDDNNIMHEWLKQVKFNRPRISANDIHQPVLLARYAASLIQGMSSSVEDASAELTDMLRRGQRCYEFAPQALLVLLLLDCSAFRKTGEMIAGLKGLQALNSDCSTSCQCGATCLNCHHSGAESSGNGVKCGYSDTDNAKILATIFQVLKDIGTSDALGGAPSPSEVIILDQIMEQVSLCIDGSLCTKAYQKERDMRRSPDVGSELFCLRASGFPRFLEYACVFGVEVMSERLKQLQEGFDLVVQALQKVEIV